MTKLQTIEAEFQTLPIEEQRKFVSKFSHLVISVPNDEDIFELTDAELAEFDRRVLNADNEPTFTSEEVFAFVRGKYVQNNLA